MEDLFRTWLQQSVTDAVQGRAVATALAVSEQPKGLSTVSLNTLSSERARPSWPQPPRVDCLSQGKNKNPSAPVYETLEAGTPTTLPRKNAHKERGANRPKSVTFVPKTLKDYIDSYNDTAVIKCAHTPYYDATRLMNVQRQLQENQWYYLMLHGDSIV